MARRFFIFLLGVLLGVMVIRFAFPGRFVEYAQYFDMDYRVLYHLKSDTIYISPNAQCHLDCLSLDQKDCLLYTSPSPRDGLLSRMPSSA